MKIALLIALFAGYALLTTARIHVFSSEATLWRSALPSTAPRVHVNVAAEYLLEGDYERALVHLGRALELIERPESAYEREAVRTLARNQVSLIDVWYPICGRPAWRSYCF